MSRSESQPAIFISYRWSEADALATLVRERLAAALPGIEIFMDVASIDAGASLRGAIAESLAKSEIVLALIGQNWSGGDVKRIAAEDDMVRFEIATALKNGLRVIPVLVNGAKMPTRAELPPEISALSDIKGLDLRHARFDDDVAHLIGTITGERKTRSPLPQRSIKARMVGALGGFALGIGLVIAVLVAHHVATDGRAAAETIGAASVFAAMIVIVIVASWLGYRRVKNSG